MTAYQNKVHLTQKNTMKSSSQSKITRHAKKQKSVTHNQEKNQSVVTDPEVTRMMELADEDAKRALMNVLKD